MSEQIKVQLQALENLDNALQCYLEGMQDICNQAQTIIHQQEEQLRDKSEQQQRKEETSRSNQEEKLSKQEYLLQRMEEQNDRLRNVESQLETQVTDARGWLKNKVTALKEYLEGASNNLEPGSSNQPQEKMPVSSSDVSPKELLGFMVENILLPYFLSPLSFVLGPFKVGLDYKGIYIGAPILGIDLGDLDLTVGPGLNFPAWRENASPELGVDVDISSSDSPHRPIVPISV